MDTHHPAMVTPARDAMICENLTKASHSIGFAIDELTEALTHADAVVAITVTHALGDARQLSQLITRLQSAINSKD